ncbi:MAG: hypothetical protein ACREQ7_22280 [Candidatus Binatia bacterium]
MGSFTESVVEEAALAWLESLGYATKHGPEIGPGEFLAERAGNNCIKCNSSIPDHIRNIII